MSLYIKSPWGRRRIEPAVLSLLGLGDQQYCFAGRAALSADWKRPERWSVPYASGNSLFSRFNRRPDLHSPIAFVSFLRSERAVSGCIILISNITDVVYFNSARRIKLSNMIFFFNLSISRHFSIFVTLKIE